MTRKPAKILIRSSGICPEEWSLSIEDYTTLREFITSSSFLQVTKLNPNKLIFFVNEMRAEDDLLLVSGDLITFDAPCEKALISAREVIRKLKRLVGLSGPVHGGSHDKWKTRDGRTVIFPRHSGDLKIGTLKSIIKQAGLEMSLEEFLAA